MLKRVPRSMLQNKTINKVYPCAPDLYGTCNRVLSGSNLHENLYEHDDLIVAWLCYILIYCIS